MSDLATIIDMYLAGYTESDPAERASLIAAAWSAEGELVDPPFDGRGHDGIAAMTDTLLGTFAGHTFCRMTEVDEHHGFGRYGWALVGPDGSTSASGTDFVQIGDDGRLSRVVGFFGDQTPVG